MAFGFLGAASLGPDSSPVLNMPTARRPKSSREQASYPRLAKPAWAKRALRIVVLLRRKALHSSAADARNRRGQSCALRGPRPGWCRVMGQRRPASGTAAYSIENNHLIGHILLFENHERGVDSVIRRDRRTYLTAAGSANM